MAEIQEEISQIIEELQAFYKENPPEDVDIEKIKLKAYYLQERERRQRAYTKVFFPKDVTVNLFGEEIVLKEYQPTTGGIITIFEKASVYGFPADAISYWLNKRGRRRAFGEFLGFIYGEVPVAAHFGRVLFEFTRDEKHILERKAHRRNLKKRKIKRYKFDSWLKGNTLTDYANPKKVQQTIWEKNNPYKAEEIRLEKIREKYRKRELQDKKQKR